MIFVIVDICTDFLKAFHSVTRQARIFTCSSPIKAGLNKNLVARTFSELENAFFHSKDTKIVQKDQYSTLVAVYSNFNSIVESQRQKISKFQSFKLKKLFFLFPNNVKYCFP